MNDYTNPVYKSNSHRNKEENRETPKKEIKQIAKAKTKRSSQMKKMTSSIITEDIHTVKEYILMDVLLPAVKKAVSDIVTNGIDMMLYGETKGRKDNSRGTRVSYTKYYDRDRDPVRRRTSRSAYDYDDIILETRGEAEEVLDRLDDLLDSYGIVSVADLYDLVGVSGSYTDNKYGWTNLRNASVRRTRDGYLLNLPKALPID